MLVTQQVMTSFDMHALEVQVANMAIGYLLYIRCAYVLPCMLEHVYVLNLPVLVYGK